MVAISSILGALALAQLQAVYGAPLESNPVTPMNDLIVLDHQHPAFGAEIEDPIYAPVFESTNAVNASTATSLRRRRMEQHTNTNIARIEAVYGPLERNAKKLPSKGKVEPMPWPGHYWPVYKDGINLRWNGNDMSPAEKYARAFGLDPQKFKDEISRNNGIESQSHRPSCQSNADCAYLKDSSACGKREGESTGRCIPTWFGICHAWAPAAIMEPEPGCDVTVKINNGKDEITFHPYDIKALMTQVYDGANVNTVFVGARYDGDDYTTDKYGRFVDSAARDLGAGFFHIAFTNLLGKLQKSFVLDVDAGPQVWNQPVRKYNILDQKSMTPEEAAKKFYKLDAYPFNSAAAKIMYVRTEFTWVVEGLEDGPLTTTNLKRHAYSRSKIYTYLLEMDNDSNIIGGEWLGDSNKDHPDFLWFPTETPSKDLVTNVGMKYSHVKDLLKKSRGPKPGKSCCWGWGCFKAF